MRLYGPTHLVVQTASHGALWEQLRRGLSLPEGRRLRIIGVTAPQETVAPVDAATLAELGVTTVVQSGPRVRDLLREHIGRAVTPTGEGLRFAVEAPGPATLLS